MGLTPPGGDAALALVPGVAALLNVTGRFASARRWGSGHINDTFAVTFVSPAREERVVLQRINRRVFPEPGKVIANAANVTRHLARHLPIAGDRDADRRSLRLVPSRSGEDAVYDTEGEAWRAWWFVDRAHSVDVVDEPRVAFEAARAFGEFQRLLLDYDGPPLSETLPGFHHTPSRFAAFRRSAAADGAGRGPAAAAEIDFALSREPLSRALADLMDSGLAPVRVTHNDTKINNVLLDDDTGEALCVVDLDTVMPGLSLYDFGDLARTASSPTAEDETELTRVGVRDDLFEALVLGYLSSAGGFLTSSERESLVVAAKVLTFTIGLRFLTDFLEGDAYFRVHREGQNLDRARAQFALVRSLEEKEAALAAVVRRAAAEVRIRPRPEGNR